ncbi:glycosyl hydrolase family 15, partial [bacterium]|nr:glycosyl hydrolase family 15 [bacterium]
MNLDHINALLEKHYSSIDKIILSRQDPITGLLPASTAITAHGDYTDAWVRDNVYSILCVWGLALAYKKHNPDHYRNYLLSQSVVKLMRGLLEAMMRQANRVETFKKTLNPTDALHA